MQVEAQADRAWGKARLQVGNDAVAPFAVLALTLAGVGVTGEITVAVVLAEKVIAVDDLEAGAVEETLVLGECGRGQADGQGEGDGWVVARAHGRTSLWVMGRSVIPITVP
ncbi:hypothetical protein D3C80_1906510 [compost metagenome]